MTSKPLISIVIPTKNRQKYCLSAIDSILQIGSDKVQIVIQDNSDTDDLKNQMPKIENEQILKYQYIPEKLSFVENFNNAIESADGQYICIIGDDDGINPEIIEATQWAKSKNIDCLVGNVEANYRWDNTGAKDTLFTKMTGSTLTITHFDGKAKKADIETSLIQLMKNGCTNYLDFDFPKLYHGVVKKEALNKLKKHSGQYLKGLSPDIYAAIALALTVDSLVVIDYPLTIPGVCAESGSIKEGQKRDHSKELSAAPHFQGRKDIYNWEDNVPKIYCVQTIWSDSAFQAVREFHREDLIKYFDEYMLCANILDADPTLEPMVMEYLKERLPNREMALHTKMLKQAKFKGPTQKFVKKRVMGRIKKILKIEKFEIINGLPNMVKATEGLKQYLVRTNINMIKELEKV